METTTTTTTAPAALKNGKSSLKRDRREYYLNNKETLINANMMNYFKRKMLRTGFDTHGDLHRFDSTEDVKKYCQFLELLKYMRESFPDELDIAMKK